MGIALNSELIKEPYIHKNMTIEGWENKMKELEIRQSQVCVRCIVSFLKSVI